MKKIIVLMIAVLSLVGLYTTAQQRNGLVLTDTQTAIDYLYANSLTRFNTVNTFMANKSLRRDEAAAFFARFSRDVLGNTPDTNRPECNNLIDIHLGHHDLGDEILDACQLGLMRGSNGRFMPTDTFSNAQAITVIVRLLEGNKPENGRHWAINYYNTAQSLLLLNGLAAANTNNLDRPISRGDVAKLIEAANTYKNQNIGITFEQKHERHINYNDLEKACGLSDGLTNSNTPIINFQYANIDLDQLDFTPSTNQVLKKDGNIYFSIKVPTRKDNENNIYLTETTLYKYDCIQSIGADIINFGEGHPYFSIYLNSFNNNILNLYYIFPDTERFGINMNYNLSTNTLSVNNHTFDQVFIDNLLHNFENSNK